MVVFVKQKTAYVMRISDWSSDVCSSDLLDLSTREDLNPPVTTARAIPGVEGGPFVEIWYEIRAEGYARFGEVRRHLVGADLEVRSETARSMPVAGRAVAIDPPAWVAAAVAASRAVLNEERAAARALFQGPREKRHPEQKRPPWGTSASVR